MPFIRITTNKKIDDGARKLMNMELGVSIEAISGKSEAWLMLEYRDGAMMAFRGDESPCAMVEVDLFGEADPDEKNNLTAAICNAVSFVFEVPTDRTYVRYLETDSWGYDCENF